MQDFRNLKVWERSHALVLLVYKVTSSFPASEAYGLTAQMRRSSASIPTKLAEGCGRSGDAELARFAQIAMGSASELEYQLLLSRDLQMLDDADAGALSSEVVEIKRMLGALLTSLRRRTVSQVTDRPTD